MNIDGRLAFIGGGNMAAALIGGLLRRGLRPAQVVVAEPGEERRRWLRTQLGVDAFADNALAAARADVVVLAVKPQSMREVSLALAPQLADSTALVISVAAGIPLAALERWFGTQRGLVRTMPNRPALSGYGATALVAPERTGRPQRELAESIMSAVGMTVWLDTESQMDVVTALSGSGPAYFFLFMEALECAARDLGLAGEIAHRLTLATALGAARLADESSEPLAALRAQVTSKGGTTEAALAVFETAELRATIARAVAAAAHRSVELAAEFGRP
ncbi:MAG: pyrroline-5-carboxylate reductase [Gammaproteobacteria bacterium]|nr:pyrroline-5-carboxylate reductase [Gammaproteobacteria bacterium]